MNYILQVFTGSWNTAPEQPEEIIRRIRGIASRIQVSEVILGWAADPSVYRTVGAFLRSSGIRMLLWLPVFAETGKVKETDAALDLWGRPVPPPAGDAGADFVFACPSSRRSLRAVTDLYEERFSGCGFDGVFLDRVRGQSFSAGVPGVLSCGCAVCREAFWAKGVDLSAVRGRYEQKKDAFFDMSSFPADGQFICEDNLARRFFEAKEEIVAEAVSGLCRYFRERGLSVGLDLFAPLVSRFVGQNYVLATRYADFIKPMLYRRTDAPAGIGYEFSAFGRYAPGALGRPEPVMDRAFLNTQLEALSRLKCGVYPGIELNRGSLVRTDGAYIAESLSAIRDYGFDSAALCWNIMEAPEEHLRAVYAAENGR